MSEQTIFPARILTLLKDVADRSCKGPHSPWEDADGLPLQDDADAALAWITQRADLAVASTAAVPEGAEATEFEKTFPDHIWLDAGEAMEFAEPGDSFRDLHEVTWSEDNATGYGVKYIRADLAHPQRDAERYRAFFDSGLPVCFMGQEFRSKEECDKAIDAAIRSAAKEVEA